MSRKQYPPTYIIELRKTPETRNYTAELAHSLFDKTAGLGGILGDDGGIVGERWDLRIISDGSFSTPTNMPGGFRTASQRAPTPGTSAAEIPGQRRPPPHHAQADHVDHYSDPSARRGPETGMFEMSPDQSSCPALVPLDESWLKPHPLLDGALEGALEDVLGEPLEPVGPTPSNRVRAAGMLNSTRVQEKSVAQPIPRRTNLSQGAPPGFGGSSPPFARSPSPKIMQDRLAKGPSANGGFVSRMAKKDRRPPLARILTVPPLPRKKVDSKTEVKPTADSASPTTKKPWKNDVDRMFAPLDNVVDQGYISCSPPTDENQILSWSAPNPTGVRLPPNTQQTNLDAKPVSLHREANGEGGKTEKAVQNDDEGELAPNVLSFFNAVKAQAVVGASSRPGVPSAFQSKQPAGRTEPKQMDRVQPPGNRAADSLPPIFNGSHGVLPPPRAPHEVQRLPPILHAPHIGLQAPPGQYGGQPGFIRQPSPEPAQAGFAGAPSYSPDEFFQFFQGSGGGTGSQAGPGGPPMHNTMHQMAMQGQAPGLRPPGTVPPQGPTEANQIRLPFGVPQQPLPQPGMVRVPRVGDPLMRHAPPPHPFAPMHGQPPATVRSPPPEGVYMVPHGAPPLDPRNLSAPTPHFSLLHREHDLSGPPAPPPDILAGPDQPQGPPRQ